MRREIKSKSTLRAKEFAIDAAQVSIIRAQNFIVPDAQRHFASVRAVRAHGRRVSHFPRSRFIAIRPARQRANGANINAHSAFFAFQMIFAIWNDRGIYATLTDAKRFHSHAFVANARSEEHTSELHS